MKKYVVICDDCEKTIGLEVDEKFFVCMCRDICEDCLTKRIEYSFAKIKKLYTECVNCEGTGFVNDSCDYDRITKVTCPICNGNKRVLIKY